MSAVVHQMSLHQIPLQKNSSNLGATAVINNRNTTNKKTSQRHVQNKTLASVTSSVRCSGSTLPVITHCNL